MLDNHGQKEKIDLPKLMIPLTVGQGSVVFYYPRKSQETREPVNHARPLARLATGLCRDNISIIFAWQPRSLRF